MELGELRSQALGERPLVVRLEVGEEQADSDRLRVRTADRSDEAPDLGFAEGLDTPPVPTRSRAPNRSRSGTSGAGFGAHRR